MAGGSVNKVILIGRLGADPEVRYTTSGGAVAHFNMATNESWTDKGSGQKQERTEWHRIIVWGKLAELCGQYLSKGRQAFIEGRIQTREWNDKDGNKRYTTEIIAQTVQFLGSQGDRASAGMGSDFASSSASPVSGSSASPDFSPSFANPEGGEKSMSDDEVPF